MSKLFETGDGQESSIISPFGGQNKKTGLISQGMTEKPGEFSNLVHLWGNEELQPLPVPVTKAEIFKIQ